MNLELGGGGQPEKLRPEMQMRDYLNMDAFPLDTVDIVHDATVAPWPFENNTVDNIYSVEFLEHISFHKLPIVLSEASRVLKPGGRFAFECPDIMGIARNLVSGKCSEKEINYMRRGILGDQNREYDIHLNALWFDYIKPLLEDSGFNNVRRFACPLFRSDYSLLPFSDEFKSSVKLCVEAFKIIV